MASCSEAPNSSKEKDDTDTDNDESSDSKPTSRDNNVQSAVSKAIDASAEVGSKYLEFQKMYHKVSIWGC